MILDQTYREKYTSLIEDDFFPYWATKVDTAFGGISNCINNYGDEKISDDKFTWSQGRWLWILGKLYSLIEKGVITKISAEQVKKEMKGTYDFIVKNCIGDDFICTYLLDQKGNKQVDAKTKRYDASIFADCFALIGLAQYHTSLHEEKNIDLVSSLYDSILKRIRQNDFLTEPYPIPQGYRVHSIPMILVNTIYETIKMKETFAMETTSEIADGLEMVNTILDDFVCNGYVREHISTEKNYTDLLLDRHVNPGHTLEDAWFLSEFLEAYGSLQPRLEKISSLVLNAFDIGWDKEFGGLLRFVDRDGGKPKGESGTSDFELLINNTWDMKLWWPHSEALYVLLYFYKKTGNDEFLSRYKMIESYVFKTFPNTEIGEWIQIRRRDGFPEEKLVALPVKDPFHILRNFIKIVELY